MIITFFELGPKYFFFLFIRYLHIECKRYVEFIDRYFPHLIKPMQET